MTPFVVIKKPFNNFYIYSKSQTRSFSATSKNFLQENFTNIAKQKAARFRQEKPNG